MTARAFVPWAALAFLLLPAGLLLLSCSDSGQPASVPAASAQALTPQEAAARAGYTDILATHGNGFLALDPHKQKRFLYLTGTHYDMGFQMGYLACAGTAVMAHDYLDEFLFEMLELPFHHEDLGVLWDLIRDLLLELTRPSADSVPPRLLEEIQGVAAGYAAAQSEGLPGTERAVAFDDLLVLNQGMDVITSLTYNTLGKVGVACNQFACWGSRTGHGELLHGRDFQFYNAGVYQDQALVAVYVPTAPDTGSAPDTRKTSAVARAHGAAAGTPPQPDSPAHLPRAPSGSGRNTADAGSGQGGGALAEAASDDPPGYSFVTVTAPGFVGLATGLNAQGISMGIDVVHCWPGRPGDPGLGGLLVVRRVMEEASTLEEAVSLVRDEDRGCPWIYLVADGKLPEAVVLETIQSSPLEPWMDTLYQKNLGLARNLLGTQVGSGEPIQGVSVRTADFVLEQQYRGKSFEVPGYSNSEKYPDNHTFFNVSFQDPLEETPEVIAATNHYLLPSMRLYQWAPLVWLIWKTYWPSTEWRYQTMVELLLERTADGPSFGWEAAWSTIDFLNPATEEGAFFYGPERDQPVGGHVCLMDGRNLVLRALYGYYDNPWVQVSLADFLP